MPDHVAEMHKWSERCDIHKHEQMISKGKASENARLMALLADHLFDCATRGIMHEPNCQKWLREYQEHWKKVYRPSEQR